MRARCLLALPVLAGCMSVVTSGASISAGPQRDSDVEPRSVAWSPDGEHVAHGAFDGRLEVTRARDGQVATLHRTRSPFIREVRWSPEGGRLLAITDRTVELLGRDGSEVLVLVPGRPPGGAAYPSYGPDFVSGEFSPDGATLVLGGWADGHVELRDARTGALRRALAGDGSRVASVSWSPDGERLVVGAWDRTVRIVAVESGEEVARIAVEPTGWVRASYAPDGRTIAWHGHGTSTWVRDVETGAERVLEKRDGTVEVAWSPDGRRVALLGPSSLDVWDVDPLRLAGTLALRRSMDRVVWSGDGLYLAASGFQGRTIVWNVRTGATRDADGQPVAFGPDMRFVAFGERVERFSAF